MTTLLAVLLLAATHAEANVKLAAEMERASHLAAAETNLQLCREEAKVTGEDADALCARRLRELEKARQDDKKEPNRG